MTTQTEEIKLLIVDDDPVYRRLVSKILRPWKLQIFTASSCSEAKEISQDHFFEICIVDGELPDGQGLDLIQWMHQTLVLLPKIAFISANEYQEIANIKESYSIDFLLHKPINRHELNDMVKAMLSHEDEAEENLSEEEAFLNKIRQDYEKSIPTKLTRVQQLINVFQDKVKPEFTQPLLRELQEIADNSSSFGYPRIHALCHSKIEDIEFALDNWPPSDTWIEDLGLFHIQLKNAFQLKNIRFSNQLLQSNEHLSASNPNVVYFISPDSSKFPTIQKALTDAGASIIHEGDPKAGLRYLLEEHFDGAILLVAQDFADYEFQGAEIINQFRSNESSPHTRVILLNDTNKIVEHKGHLTINESFGFVFLKDLFLKILNPTVFVPWNILILHEDNHLKNIFEGMEDPQIQLHYADELPKSNDFDFYAKPPELICLSATQEHLDWLSVINQVATFSGTLFWVFGEISGARLRLDNIEITWFEEIDIKRPLIVPLVRQYLKQSRQHASTQTYEEHTGLYTRASFIEHFHVAFSRATRYKTPLSMAMIDIRALHRLNDQPDHPESHVLVQKIGRFFKEQFRKTDILCRWHGSIFCVFFEGINYRTTKFITDKVIQNFSQWDAPFLLDEQMRISIGISHFPEYGQDLSSLVENSLMALENSQTSKISKSVLCNDITDINPSSDHHRKILILDSDNDVLTMLSYSFSLRGYDVITSNSGEEVLQGLRDRKWSLPDLIVLDRELQDMDGINVLEQIHSERLCSAPIVFLSAKSTEEQILRGLKMGAADYIVKPFSLDIFFAKCQRLLGL